MQLWQRMVYFAAVNVDVCCRSMTDQKHITRDLVQYLQLAIFASLVLYFGKSLFIPLFYGLFIAVVLYPLCKWLELRHWPRSLAIALSLSIVVLLFGALLVLLVLEIRELQRDLPQLLEKLRPSVPGIQQWVEENLYISKESQFAWWQQMIAGLSNSMGALLSGTAGALFQLMIVPVFAALFLYNRRDFVLFLDAIAGDRYKGRMHQLLHSTLHTYHEFIKGMVLVYIIVGILNSLGLLLLGIEHALLFGFLTAIMTIIPYIGIIVSALLPISVAWLTNDSVWYPLGVVAMFSIVQYLEANVIFPKVVGTQINVNTWATLVAILAGGILWGLSGMILFIPFVGILKIITDDVPEWKALNILLRRNEASPKTRNRT